MEIDYGVCGMVNLVRENNCKFDMGTPDLNKFVYSWKIRIGTWAKELLGLPRVPPHDFVNNLEAVIS